jgi:predicted Zn-dependent protease
MMDQLREAILWLRRSTEANPNLGINYSLLAAVCSLDGRDEEARLALSECLRIRPTMTLSKLRASPFSTHPTYLAWRERFYEGLRKAGLPEE